jgi:hypothetical protein
MTYLCIDTILTLPEDIIINYSNELIQNGDHNADIETYLLNISKNTYFLSDDLVLRFIRHFLIENYENISYSFYTSRFCEEEDLVILTYIFNGVSHSIVIPKTFKDSFEQDAVLLESGVQVDMGNIDALENRLNNLEDADKTKVKIYLQKIGVRIPKEDLIPVNSDSLLQDETTSRFNSAIWFEEIQKKVIILAGVGGIGSYVSFLLARMKPRALFIYDNDDVEFANMSGQLYSIDDVNRKKVNAIANMISKYAMYDSVFAIPDKFTEESEATDIMICGFDNMKARKVFFNKWVDHINSKSDEDKKHCLFIDGRLAAEELQVFCIQGDDTYNITNYQDNFLFSDEEADATICSYKQTTFMANMIGSIIINLFTNFVANEIMENLRDLPFMTSYEAESMIFKTKN